MRHTYLASCNLHISLPPPPLPTISLLTYPYCCHISITSQVVVCVPLHSSRLCTLDRRKRGAQGCLLSGGRRCILRWCRNTRAPVHLHLHQPFAGYSFDDHEPRTEGVWAAVISAHMTCTAICEDLTEHLLDKLCVGHGLEHPETAESQSLIKHFREKIMLLAGGAVRSVAAFSDAVAADNFLSKPVERSLISAQQAMEKLLRAVIVPLKSLPPLPGHPNPGFTTPGGMHEEVEDDLHLNYRCDICCRIRSSNKSIFGVCTNPGGRRCRKVSAHQQVTKEHIQQPGQAVSICQFCKLPSSTSNKQGHCVRLSDSHPRSLRCVARELSLQQEALGAKELCSSCELPISFTKKAGVCWRSRKAPDVRSSRCSRRQHDLQSKKDSHSEVGFRFNVSTAGRTRQPQGQQRERTEHVHQSHDSSQSPSVSVSVKRPRDSVNDHGLPSKCPRCLLTVSNNKLDKGCCFWKDKDAPPSQMCLLRQQSNKRHLRERLMRGDPIESEYLHGEELSSLLLKYPFPAFCGRCELSVSDSKRDPGCCLWLSPDAPQSVTCKRREKQLKKESNLRTVRHGSRRGDRGGEECSDAMDCRISFIRSQLSELFNPQLSDGLAWHVHHADFPKGAHVFVTGSCLCTPICVLLMCFLFFPTTLQIAFSTSAGPAGTGKSVDVLLLSSHLLDKTSTRPLAVGITASTGIAAAQICGVTFHRMFDLNPTSIRPMDPQWRDKLPPCPARAASLEYLIIDEVRLHLSVTLDCVTTC